MARSLSPLSTPRTTDDDDQLRAVLLTLDGQGPKAKAVALNELIARAVHEALTNEARRQRSLHW